MVIGMPIRGIWNHLRTTGDELAAYQDRALCKLVTFAYTHVDFYRSLFDEAGVCPDDIRGVADLNRLPFTSKRIMRQAPPVSRLARSLSKQRMARYRTTGSTGEPFTVQRTAWEDLRIELFRKRVQWQFGVRPWHRLVAVALPRVLGHQHGRVRSLLNTLRLFRKQVIECSQPMDQLLSTLAQINPHVLHAYPHVLARIARALTDRERDRIHPRLLLCGGDQLSAVHRKLIEESFRAPLFEIYGAHEFNVIASQCPTGQRLHVCGGNVVVEVLREGVPAKEGEQGEVVVTALNAYAVPFIRFKLGDLAVRGPDACDCGKTCMTLERVVGRTVPYYTLPEGRSIHPFTIEGQLEKDPCDWIDRSQLVHEALDRIVLRVVPFREPRADEVARMETLARCVLPDDVQFCVELTTDIAPASGGKFQPFVDLCRVEDPA